MCNLADFGWELASAYFMYRNTGTYSTFTRGGRPLLVGGRGRDGEPGIVISFLRGKKREGGR